VGQNNPEKYKAAQRRHYLKHKEKILLKTKEYVKNLSLEELNNLKEKKKILCAAWYKQNQSKILEKAKVYQTQRRQVDLNFKLRCYLRSRLSHAIKNGQKIGSAVEDLGYSLDDLKKHLESQFYPNSITGEVMSWDNYGRDGWEIDHIEPLAKFDLSIREHFLNACNYRNLQPLWWQDNAQKSDNIVTDRGFKEFVAEI
jgi:hypothetical protein